MYWVQRLREEYLMVLTILWYDTKVRMREKFEAKENGKKEIERQEPSSERLHNNAYMQSNRRE